MCGMSSCTIDGIIDLIGDDGHQRSTNGGVSWTSAGVLFGGLSSIAVSPDEPNVLFATTGTSIWQSADGGATWTGLTNPCASGADSVRQDQPAVGRELRPVVR